MYFCSILTIFIILCSSVVQYDFHKTVADPSNGQFQHIFFLQGRRDLLHLIKRKAHNQKPTGGDGSTDAAAVKKGTVPAATAASSFSTAPPGASHMMPKGTVSEFEGSSAAPVGPGLGPGKQIKTEVDRRVRESEKQHNRTKELEASQAKIIRENIHLNQLLNETRAKQQLMADKMDKILKLLYCMYTKTPLSRVMNPSSENGNGSRISNFPDSSFSDICNFLQLDVPFAKKNRYAYHYVWSKITFLILNTFYALFLSVSVF